MRVYIDEDDRQFETFYYSGKPGVVYARAVYPEFGTFQIWKDGLMSGDPIVTRKFSLQELRSYAEIARRKP